MADGKANARPELIIRGAPGKQAGLALGSLAFLAVGALMLVLPPPRFWSAAAATAVGILALLFGLAGLITAIYVVTRPILLLYPDRLVDVRRGLTIPFAEIREVAQVAPDDQSDRLARWLSPQWLLLYMHDPARYDMLRSGKRWRLTEADLILDLSLASAADFAQAHAFVVTRIVTR